MLAVVGLTAVLLLGGGASGVDGIAMIVALSLLIGACVWLVMLPGVLFLARASSRLITVEKGVFSYSVLAFGWERRRYSVPIEEVRWETGDTRKDHFLRHLWHARRACVVATVPVRIRGVKVMSAKLACGLTEQSRERLAAYLDQARKAREAVPPNSG